MELAAKTTATSAWRRLREVRVLKMVFIVDSRSRKL